MSDNKTKESKSLLTASAQKKIEGMLDTSQDSLSSDEPQSSLHSLSDMEENESESLSSIHLSPQKPPVEIPKKKEQTNEDQPAKKVKKHRHRRRRHRPRRSLAEIISEISTETESDVSEQGLEENKKKNEKCGIQEKKGDTPQEKKLPQIITVKEEEEEESDEESCNKNQIVQEKTTQNIKKPLPNRSTDLQSTLESFRDNQSLTIEEMETMSKLLSIQANELQKKQKTKKNSNKFNQQQQQQQQQRPPSFKALLGELPMKKFKQETEIDTSHKSQIVQKNINALMGQLHQEEDPYEGVGTMGNRSFMGRKQIHQQEQLQHLKQYQGANNLFQTNGIGYPLRQNVSFNGKLGEMTSNCASQGYLKESNGIQQVNSMFGMRNNTGKITPTIRGHILGNRFEQSRQQLNNVADIESEIQSRVESIKQEIAPLLAYLDSGLLTGGATTGFSQSYQDKQYIYNNVDDLDMNSNINNISSGQIDSTLNSRIYQEIREKRAQLQIQDQQYKEQQLLFLKQQIQLKLSQQQELEQQQQQFLEEYELQQQENIQLRNSQNRQARILTPTMPVIQMRQIEKGQGIMNYDSSRGQRQPNRDSNINNNNNINNNIHGHQQIGRNYDARAGDWLCGNCRNFNFAYREICNRCGLKQDENVMMVHPQITKEALDLIHELNNGMKKQQQRNSEEIKRTYDQQGQNKENFRTFQNVTKNNIASDIDCNQQNRLNQQIISKIFPTSQRQFQQQGQCVAASEQQQQQYGQLEDCENPINYQKQGLSYDQYDGDRKNRVFTSINQQPQNSGIMQALKSNNQQANSMQLAKKAWNAYPRIDIR